MSTATIPATVPCEQFRSLNQSVKPSAVADHLPMNKWVKELRAEIGRRRKLPRPISQSALAELLHVGLSAVAKWEMTKEPQEPERDSYVRLMKLASPELRARAPQLVDLPEMSDRPGKDPAQTDAGAKPVGITDGEIVARDIDRIPDPMLRQRVRNAALKAIEETQREAQDPSELGAGRGPGRAQRK